MQFATDVVRRPLDLSVVIRPDRAVSGAVTRPVPGGGFRRGESDGLVFEALPVLGGVRVRVYGDDPAAAEAALPAARAWAGLEDEPAAFEAVARVHPVVRELQRRLGTPVLSRLPRVDEAVGRAVIYQLVQAEEALRSCLRVAATLGSPAGDRLWCWPSRARLRSTQDWSLRRCGVSGRGARSIRAAATHARRLDEVRGDWALLDHRIRALPGCGGWTSAKARLALGDPDAVPMGDYNLPALVGHVLSGSATDDDGMLTLLEPFTGQRGRVIALVGRALREGLVRKSRRTAPRAALSAHRYW